MDLISLQYPSEIERNLAKSLSLFLSIPSAILLETEALHI